MVLCCQTACSKTTAPIADSCSLLWVRTSVVNSSSCSHSGLTTGSFLGPATIKIRSLARTVRAAVLPCPENRFDGGFRASQTLSSRVAANTASCRGCAPCAGSPTCRRKAHADDAKYHRPTAHLRSAVGGWLLRIHFDGAEQGRVSARHERYQLRCDTRAWLHVCESVADLYTRRIEGLSRSGVGHREQLRRDGHEHRRVG